MKIREEIEDLIYKYEDMSQKPLLYWKPLAKEILGIVKSQLEEMGLPLNPHFQGDPTLYGVYDSAQQELREYILSKLFPK